MKENKDLVFRINVPDPHTANFVKFFGTNFFIDVLQLVVTVTDM